MFFCTICGQKKCQIADTIEYSQNIFLYMNVIAYFSMLYSKKLNNFISILIIVDWMTFFHRSYSRKEKSRQATRISLMALLSPVSDTDTCYPRHSFNKAFK